VNDLAWTFLFEPQIAPLLCRSRSLLATIQVKFGDNNQAPRSPRSLSRAAQVSARMWSAPDQSALPATLHHEFPKMGNRRIEERVVVGPRAKRLHLIRGEMQVRFPSCIPAFLWRAVCLARGPRRRFIYGRSTTASVIYNPFHHLIAFVCVRKPHRRFMRYDRPRQISRSVASARSRWRDHPPGFGPRQKRERYEARPPGYRLRPDSRSRTPHGLESDGS